MRFSLAAVLAFVASALATDPTPGFNPITKPTQGEEVPAGSTYEIVWQPSAANPGAITIGLLGGASPATLSVVDTIAKSVDPSTGSYSWKVPADATLATYGIIITLESDTKVFQYGFPFKIVGGSSASASSTVSASSSGSASATGGDSTSATTTASGTGSASVTAASSTSFSAPSSTVVSSTIRGNLSTTASGNAQTTITTVVSGKPSTTKSSTTSVVTNGVASLAAGSFAMLGGVAMAVLAL